MVSAGRQITTAHLAQAALDCGADVRILTDRLIPFVPGGVALGWARTVVVRPDDNLGAHAVLDLAEAGSVLVIGGGSGSRAIWGGLMAQAASVRGVAGVIVDGPIRDLAAIRGVGLPVWARSVVVLGSDKLGPFELDAPVFIERDVVRAGDVVLADDDGIVVVASKAEEALAAAERRAFDENGWLTRIRGGESLADVLAMDRKDWA